MRRAAALFGLLAVAVGGVWADVLDDFGGPPYEGQVGMEIHLPGGSSDTRWGRGSVQLVENAPGQARLVIASAMSGEQTRSQLEIPGRIEAGGWRSDVPGVKVEIAPSGAIQGGGEEQGRTLRFEGRLSEARADLVNRVGLANGLRGLPPGSEVIYRYRLNRDAPAAAADAASTRGQRCKRMAMRGVPIANTAGGGVSMAQVPYCAEPE